MTTPELGQLSTVLSLIKNRFRINLALEVLAGITNMMLVSGVISGLLQAHWKGVQAFRSYQQHRAAIVLQRRYRGFLARQAFAKQHAAAVYLQTAWRRHSAQMRFAKTLLAVTRLQASLTCQCPVRRVQFPLWCVCWLRKHAHSDHLVVT